MKQLLLFPEIIQSAVLVADSPRMAFYRLCIEQHQKNMFCVHKISGSGNRPLDRRRWCFASRQDAEKRFHRLLGTKTDPNRKSPRKYRPVSL
jgi:hypothetical protein